MKDIILPVTCYQIKLGLFITLGVTALLSLIFSGDNDLLKVYGGVGMIVFGAINGSLLLLAYAEDKLPRFPIRCKCDKE